MLLTVILLLPILASGLIFILGRWLGDNFAKYLTLAISVIEVILSGILLLRYWTEDALNGFKLLESLEWFPDIGVTYMVGVDGVSLTLIVLTAFITCMAVLASWTMHEENMSAYFALMLLLTTGILGTFLFLDLFFFFIAWELVLVPMFFLIGKWGGPNRKYAAMKFFIYTHVASVFLMVGIFATYVTHWLETGVNTFNMITLASHGFNSDWTMVAVFLGIMFGFIVKVPSAPFHTWLPDAHVEAPSPISMILAGLLLKMGGYGIIRILLQVLDDVFKKGVVFLNVPVYWIVGLVGLISIFWGGLVALRQNDVKRLVAYSSISHMGYVLLGVAAYVAILEADPTATTTAMIALQGAIFMMIAHGIISPALFQLCGMLQHWAGTREINLLKGLPKSSETTSIILVAFSFASAGLPGMMGFIAEFTILIGVFRWNPTLALITVLGIVLTAAYYLWMLQRVVFGEKSEFLDEHAKPVPKIEYISLALMFIVVLIFGLYPTPIFDLMAPILLNPLAGI
ncbi:MAG: complex I subunit 4 family protein [Candidatus Hodarchaeales archaeon]|jgi:NADH-quinone oxidoreductase subunit M